MCTSPSILYTDGTITPKTGKRCFHFRPFDPDKLEEFRKYKKEWKLNYNYFLIPCGHCTECRLKYRKEWAIRLLNELEMSDNAYFLTITYNDDHLPPSNSLNKAHLSRYMKSIYKACEDFYKKNNVEIHKKFRMFAIGEYGSSLNTHRPHYHAIIYNVPFDDFTPNFPDDNGGYTHHNGSNGDQLLYSETLSRIWNKGFVVAGKVTYNSCSYVAGYVQKKLNGDEAQLYVDNFLLPPFLICSKGIGSSYFVANKDKLLETDEVFYNKNGKVCKASIPRYYLKLLEKEDPVNFQYIKYMRSKLADSVVDEVISTDYKSLHEYFRNREKVNKNKVSRLVRR